jgi:hypothetical protein
MGHRYEYVLFSGLGHNNMDPTFHVATDWIRQLAATPATDDATRSATSR